MATKKILFFIIAGVITVIIFISLALLSQPRTPSFIAPKEIKIWINEWSTEDYASLIEWFKQYAPEFASTNIIFEKKTTDPIRYRTLLLSMMSDNMSPDIFMIGAWEDAILRSRIEPIPEKYIDIWFFEREYDDIFLPLIVSTGSRDTITRSLLGVPLGFETMWIFYNKNLIREVPRTWEEIDRLYERWISRWIYVSNLWLWPRYTQNMSDILSLMLMRDGTKSILNIQNTSADTLSQYLGYKNYSDWSTDLIDGDIYSQTNTLADYTKELEKTKTTTFDMFLEWKIWMIFGFPSTVLELEKSDKRIGSEKTTAWLILASKIPTTNTIESIKNIVHYNYFAISRWSQQQEASLRFLQYLMSTDAQRRYIEKNPHQIAAQRSFWIAQKTQKISNILKRITLDTFIPDIDEQLSLFEYGLKAEFQEFLWEYLDRNDNMDISNILDNISTELSCTILPYDTSIQNTKDCEKK